MKIHKQSILVLVLVGLVVYQSAVQNRAHREVQQLSRQFTRQLDTLSHIATRYDRIQQHYENIHKDLLLTQHRTQRMHQELNRLSLEQHQDVQVLQAEIQALLQLTQVENSLLPSHSIDSLLFKP